MARSQTCEYPPSITFLPACTSVNFNTDLPSGKINKDFKDLIINALSIYQIDEQLLKTIAPDIIFTQSQCDVCSISETEVSDAVGKWINNRVNIVSLKSNQLSDIWQDITLVAQAINLRKKGKLLISELRKRLKNIEEKCAALSIQPRVACIE